MKKFTILLLFCLSLTGCKTFIAGSPVDSFKNMTAKDAGYMVVGAVASLAVHEGAHMVTCEIVGADYSLHGLSVEYSGNLSESDHRWINRAGLLTQNVVGLFLDSSNFSKGLKYCLLSKHSLTHYDIAGTAICIISRNMVVMRPWNGKYIMPWRYTIYLELNGKRYCGA